MLPSKNSFLVFSVWLLSLVSFNACQAETLRPADLIANPKAYLNRKVDVQIVEPLSGPSTPSALASAEYGEVRVDIPDAIGTNLALVPASFQMEDPNRYRRKFDRVIEAPVWVHGEFLNDEEMEKAMHRPYYVIRVSSMESIPVSNPERVASLSDLKSNPGRWDRKLILYEGVYQSGFEVSALDKEIWLSTARNTTILGQPSPVLKGRQTDRVRVTGLLFAKPGTSYGHLGGYGFEIHASKLEYLGPAVAPSP